MAAAMMLLENEAKYAEFKGKYRLDPAGFARNCIVWNKGEGLASYQEESLTNLVKYGRESDRGPHGLGKSMLAAVALLWFALTRDGEDWKAVTTASAWRQLTKFLWPEIHKWTRKLKWSEIGRKPFDARLELLTLSLKLSTGEAFAVASDNPALIEGAHADHMFYVFDESKSIPAAVFDAAEGAFSGKGEVFALAISTPGEPAGRFYEVQSRKPGFEDWHVRHVTLAEAIAAGRIDSRWAEQRKTQWGEQSAVYQNRVLGEFAASEEDGVIPLSWVEAANERWQQWVEQGSPQGQFCGVGVDVARSGEDKTVLALRYDDVITQLRRFSKEDTMQTSGRVAGVLKANGGKAIVDVIGVGAGVVDKLREDGYKVDAFNASERSEQTDRSNELGFVNKRSAAWWNMRELLDPANDAKVALPPDDLLTGDLTAPHWKVVSGGKIQVESKDDIKKRLGRSTDDGDAVVMVFAAPEHELPFGWMKVPK